MKKQTINKIKSRKPYPITQHYSNEKRDKYPNGDIWCERWLDRIDRTTCIARTAVYPLKCLGCPANL